MTLLLKDTTELTLIAVIVTVLVVVAMSIDLVTGVMKAKERGEVCTSYGLHRTLYKFLTYTGSCICAYCIDLMLHFAHLWDLLSLDLLHNVPVVTVIVGAFSCFVELVSIREKATSKEERHATEQLVHIIRTLGSDDVARLLEAMGKLKKN